MATIRDVAQRAGVSVSSVSNVLNGRSDRMRKETLLRIEQAINELQFQPSRAALQLKTGQVSLLGLLVPSIVNPSFASLAHEVDIAARRYGYRVLLGNTYRNPAEENAFINDLLSQGVRGVIVASTMVEQKFLHSALQRGLVMVNYDVQSQPGCDTETAPQADRVSMDNFQAGKLAAYHLIERGCRRITFATETGKSASRSSRINGFLSAVKEAGLSDSCTVLEGKASEGYGDAEMTELGKQLAEKIAQSSMMPQGIVAINDMMAIGLIAGLRAQNIRVPQDISIIGFDNTLMSALFTPSLTSVAPPLANMATTMVERLMERLADNAIPAGEYLFSPQLVMRESVITR